MTNHIRHAFDVHIDHVGEFFRRHLPQRSVAIDDGGIVEQQIGRAQSARDGVTGARKFLHHRTTQSARDARDDDEFSHLM